MTELFPLTEVLDSCPICEGVDFIRSHKPDICKCRKCHIHFRNPRPEQALIRDDYDKGTTFHQWQYESKIRNYLWKKRVSLITSYRNSGSLLDIGTGDGYFLGFVKDKFDVEATEISKCGIKYAKKLLPAVHQGTIFDTEFDDKKYDVITMWHVLEHLPEPGRALRRIKSLLKPGGLLFIAVPNEFSKLYSMPVVLNKRHPFCLLKRSEEIHLVHYTPHVLLKTLNQEFGFNVLKLDVADVHLDKRGRKFISFQLNRLCSKVFNFHLEVAMVVVCSANYEQKTHPGN